MSIWVTLIACADWVGIERDRAALQWYHSDDLPSYWESYTFDKLWMELSFPNGVPDRDQIDSLMDCVIADDSFIEAMIAGEDSTLWSSIEGVASAAEYLASRLGEEPCPFETALRRVIVQSATRVTFSAGLDEFRAELDKAWPDVESQRSDWLQAIQQELRDLAAAVRELESRGETHIRLVMG